ncbi:MAG TPA: phosphotransferase, partial [Micromonosporaceae bacterium]|nr:phosphotransferase [Micromonosporaceae bacterium]
MLPLSQIRRFAQTVDAAGCSPAADRVAAAWGYPPGAARHCRTSANHVFTIGGTAYLRFLPAAYRDRDRVSRVAGLMRRLHDEGLPVAEPVPSTNGDLVETVSTDNGPVHAMLVQTAPGEQLDVDSLTPQRARAWGAALARLHRDCQYHDGLPDWFEDLAFDGDPALSTAIGALAGALSTLPRTRLGYGFCHGDFELDNMAWRG